MASLKAIFDSYFEGGKSSAFLPKEFNKDAAAVDTKLTNLTNMR